MRCGINTGSRNPSVHPALVMGLSSSTLLWFDFEGHSPPIWDQSNSSFLCFVWGDAHQVAFHHFLYWWPVFSVQELVVAKGGELSWDLGLCLTLCVSLHQSLLLHCLLGCVSVGGAACVRRGWHRLCCWYSRLNFAPSAMLSECSSPSVVWEQWRQWFLTWIYAALEG